MRPQKHPQNAAFSIVELLVTISILAILMVTATPALLSNQRSSALTSAGNTVADMTTLARQTAQSKNTITALVIANKTSKESKQGLTIFEYDQTSENWKPVTGWVRIPEAATVQDQGDTNSTSIVSNLAPLAITISGTTLSSGQYSAILFYPDGRMESGTNATRRVRAYPSSDNSNAPNNYYDVVVNANTSAFHINRP